MLDLNNQQNYRERKRIKAKDTLDGWPGKIREKHLRKQKRSKVFVFMITSSL